MATPVLMPKQGNTVEECVLLGWRIKVGDSVKTGDIIGEIETDKATFELEAPEDGTVLALLIEEGDTAPVLSNIAVIGKEGEDISSFGAGETADAPAGEDKAEPAPAAEAKPEPAAETPAPAPAASSGGKASPRAKKAAAEKNVPIDQLEGTGPEGRVIERDVVKAASEGLRLTPLASKIAQDSGKAVPSAAGAGRRVLASALTDAGTSAEAGAPDSAEDYEEIKLSGMRKTIASRMISSMNEHAQLTLNTTAPAESMMNFRKKVKESGEKLGLVNISLGDMVNYAVARTLATYPEVNATLKDGILRKYSRVHLGFACNTDRGLMVPVLRDAHALTLNSVAAATKDLAGQAKSGAINPDLLQGGTFTVSNLGILGITTFTPVLNSPQVALLGVGSIEPQPVRKGGEVVFEDRIHLSLTIDHQVIDGWVASEFLKSLTEAISSFELLLSL